jgi:hypothetical protein
MLLRKIFAASSKNHKTISAKCKDLMFKQVARIITIVL